MERLRCSRRSVEREPVQRVLIDAIDATTDRHGEAGAILRRAGARLQGDDPALRLACAAQPG